MMKQGRRFPLVVLSAALLALSLAAVALGQPWFAVAVIALAIESLLLCWSLREGLAQNLSLALGVALLVTAGLDLHVRRWAYHSKIKEVFPYDYKASAFDRPTPQPATFHHVATVVPSGELIYDVTYTLDQNGHRLTKGGGTDADTYLFFGDSYTYGHGIGDDDTMPVRFSAAMDYRFTVVNLAFHGYAPNQMLRLLEKGSVDRVATGRVRRAYFGLIADHPNRVVGKDLFSLVNGPQYVLGDDGRPVFTGKFLDHWLGRLGWLAEKAEGLPQRLRTLALDYFAPRQYRNDLVVAIMEESKRLLAEEYRTGLVVLVWDSRNTAELEAGLIKKGICVVKLSRLIGDLNAPGLRLMPGVDGHPTGKANEKIARALAAMENAPTAGDPNVCVNETTASGVASGKTEP